MSEKDLKLAIQNAIQQFDRRPLAYSATALLEMLGYHSEKRLALVPNTAAQFQAVFDPQGRLNAEKALPADWHSVDLLFQITDEEIQGAISGQGMSFANRQVDNAIINSYLFFAVGLKGDRYTRTQLANVTREINKLFPMPVMLIFKHGSALTMAIIARRLHKRDPGRDVLEKVTLIKDIAITQPHRAHVEILHDLSVGRLTQMYGFSNFIELQRAWEKTLDTSELNKKFFREVANWYFWAVKNVAFSEGAGADVESRNAVSVIRLITRLIFVWFIKEKGLVPEALFDPRRLKDILNFTDPKKSTYYKAILQNLFFATLNTEMGAGRRFRGKNRSGGLDAHYGISIVYRYEEYFKDPQATLRLFAEIPFLNGGLFECLDKREQKILVDGFSDDPRNQPAVPDALIFGEEHTEDLSAAYGDARHARDKVRGLIHIFNSYKFTIEENTPIEEEIALDPELLGKVFENLLAAYNPETGTTARKQTGSFYTPREIVNYMVDEALIAYLEIKLEGAEISKVRLRHLLAYNNEPYPFSEAEVKQLIAAIDAVKLLDPACGSGAFPMGVLHKLVYILGKLDPDNTHWRELQRQKAILETEEAYKIGNHEDRRQRLLEIDETFENNANDYGRKLYLIENCIYGVDIQPIAVQIAKLRFFISLVVDQKVDRSQPNLGVRPLPNLETKFVAANTLIGIDRISQEQNVNKKKPSEIPELDLQLVTKEQELRDTLRQFFLASKHTTQEKWRTQGQELCQEINHLLEKSQSPRRLDPGTLFNLAVNYEFAVDHLASIPKAERPKALLLSSPEIRGLEQELARVRKDHFSARTPKRKRECREKDAFLRAELAELLKKGGWGGDTAAQLATWDPYDHNASADFFDPEWMFGVVEGFDITVGNPPYVRADSGEAHLEMRRVIEACGMYETLWEKWDLYIPFIERSYKLLKPGGFTTLIVSNAYCHSKYAQKSQTWFLKHGRICRLDFLTNIKLFDAEVRNMTYLFQLADGQHNVPLRRLHDPEFGKARFLPSSEQSHLTYRVFFPEDTQIPTISKPTNRLEEICYISVGMVVHADEERARGAFELSDLVADHQDDLHSKHFVEGKYLERWLPVKHIWLEWGTERAPSLFRRPTFPELYEAKEKLISVDMAAGVKQLRVVYDNQQLYHNHSAWSFVPWHSLTGIRNNSIKRSARYRDEKPPRPDLPRREHLENTSRRFTVKYLLAVMNSSAAQNILRANRRSNIHLYPDDWKKLPIPDVPLDQQAPIVTLVDQILAAKEFDRAADVSGWEAEVDRRVYALYGLTEEEIDVVEQSAHGKNT